MASDTELAMLAASCDGDEPVLSIDARESALSMRRHRVLVAAALIGGAVLALASLMTPGPLVLRGGATSEAIGLSVSCRDALKGEDCFDAVVWAMRTGFKEHREWYPSWFGSTTSFKEFQADLHSKNLSNCPRPCGQVGCQTLAPYEATPFLQECYAKVVRKLRLSPLGGNASAAQTDVYHETDGTCPPPCPPQALLDAPSFVGRDVGAGEMQPRCQALADNYCAQTCVLSERCRPVGKLRARLAGPMQTSWRCYSELALNNRLDTFHNGGCYCTRDKEIRAIQMACDPNPPVAYIFYAGLGGVSCYRIPSVVQTDLGTLVAFAEARRGSCKDEATTDIMARRSLDGGISWEPMASAVAGNGGWLPSNPTSVFSRTSKMVILLYAMHSLGCAGNCGSIGNGIVTSNDDGATWTAPRSLTAQWGAAAVGSVVGPGTASQLDTGRIVVATHKGAYKGVFVFYSDDDGSTWTRSSCFFPDMDETTVVQLPNNTVVVNMRHKLESTKGRAYALSNDGAANFGPILYDSRLVGPVCEASMVSFGGVVYFSNPRSPTARAGITVQCSTDNSVTWSDSKLVEDGDTSGYTSLVPGPLLKDDGGFGNPPMGGIVYEGLGKTGWGSIVFAKFPLGTAGGTCLSTA